MDKLAGLVKTTCSCKECIDACVKKPCWGTPEDIEKIMDAGHISRLMRDWWERSPGLLYIIAPAIIGFE